MLCSALVFSSCEDEQLNQNTYALEENAVVKWKGYSPALFHDGSFKVQSQDIEVSDGKLVSGAFTIQIGSIENFDLPEEMKPVLLEHLKSPDFFNLALYPSASFRITQVQSLANPSEGNSHNVTGDFTMLGQTHPISFPAMISLQGNTLQLKANLKLDRTKWGMNYAADPALGDHHILPEVDIQFDLKANRM